MSKIDISKTTPTLQFAPGSSPVPALTCPGIPETDLPRFDDSAHGLFTGTAPVSALVACAIQVRYAG